MKPKTVLTVLNDEYMMITGHPFYLERAFTPDTRTWRYRFADGMVRVTYVGALLHMRQGLARVHRERNAV
jgi:hypothetical protein